MSIPVIIVLTILSIAFILFLTGVLRPDAIAILVMLCLVMTGVISPEDSFIGFSSHAVMTVAGLLVITEGLKRTGVVLLVARKLENLIGKSFNRLLLINSSMPAVLSAFITVMPSVSFLIPVILRLCLRMKVSPSRILMPMASIALIGANLTLIGASHNLVVHSLLKESQGVGFSFFEFSIVGICLLLASLLYIFFIGRHLLPNRQKLDNPRNSTVTANLIQEYELKNKLFEAWVSTDLEAKHLSIADLDLYGKYGLDLLEVVREGSKFVELDDFDLQSGDTLLLKGTEQAAKDFCEYYSGITYMGPPRAQEKYPISSAELAEAVVPPRSPVMGKTPNEINFRGEYGLTVIAYYRDGKPHASYAQDVKLQEGDGLLFYGPRNAIRDFEPNQEILIYYKPGIPEVSAKKEKLAPLAAAILLAVVVAAASDFIPISVAAIAGAILMTFTGIINPVKSYDAIDWKIIVLIGGMYPVGIALIQTGTADIVGDMLVNAFGDYGPLVLMAGVSLLTMILTQPIHNAVVAIIMTPIAINAAELMGTNPRAFCVAVLVSCSSTFLMSVGHPAPLMVQLPGDYNAMDYLKFGLPLNIIAMAVILLVVPMLWPL
jgi:di/tricarboxylate transporter